MLTVKSLDWDSSFFGFPVASVSFSSDVKIDQELNELKKKGYRLVYLFMPEQYDQLQTHLLNKYGGILIDNKITFKKQLNHITHLNYDPNIKINLYSEVNDSLIKLAILSGTYSRFKMDPNISDTQFRKIYTEWIKKSVSGINAEYVLTHHTDDKPDGLITLSFIGRTGKIGLISVSDEVQNKGIGTSLMNAAFNLCMKKSMINLEVVTQVENHAACNLYYKNDLFQNLPNADKYSDCLLRLPLFFDLKESQIEKICSEVKSYYQKL